MTPLPLGSLGSRSPVAHTVRTTLAEVSWLIWHDDAFVRGMHGGTHGGMHTRLHVTHCAGVVVLQQLHPSGPSQNCVGLPLRQFI